jgi:hypothetical protein
MKLDPCAGLSLAERRARARCAYHAPLSEEEVDALVPYPELRTLLACNPNLPEASLARLVSGLLHGSMRDEECFDDLAILAAAGRLGPFDWALREVIARIEPGRRKAATLARRHVPALLLQCPVLPDGTRTELERRLAAAWLERALQDFARCSGADWRASAEPASAAPLSPDEVSALFASPKLRRLLAFNPNLAPPAFGRLEAELLRQSPRYPDHECYEILGLLGCQGRLSDHAQGDLFARITRPTSWITSMNPNPGLATNVLLRCPDLSAESLTGLDRRLVDTGRVHGRPRLVLHPGATTDVWFSMLRHRPSPDVVRLIWEIPEATAHPGVRALLEEYRQRVTGGEGPA